MEYSQLRHSVFGEEANIVMIRIIFVATAAIILSLNSSRAQGQNSVHLCSQVPYELFVALGYTNQHGWQAKGWYSILPGQCISPDIGKFSNRYYYYYAQGGNREWNDPTGPNGGVFCIMPRIAFHLKSENNCRFSKRFKRIDIGSRPSNHTLNLRCPDCTQNLNNGETFGGEPRLAVYGKWCGTGHPRGPHPGAPIDRLDQICHDHDRAYHKCNRTTNGARRTQCEADADLRMVANLTQLAGSGRLNPKQIAYASVMASAMVTAANARYTWTVARNIEAEGQRAMKRVQKDVGRVARDSKRTLNTFLQNARNDLRHGPGPNNELCRLTPFC